MSMVLCSTGALIGRSNGRDYRLLEPLSRQLTCDGLEFMMYSSWYKEVDSLTAALKKMRLNIPVMHCEKHIGEFISKGGSEDLAEAIRRFEINCDIAKKIGSEKLVIHLWDGITSDAYFQNNLFAFSQLMDISVKYGLELLVENVVCNREDPMTHWCQLREAYPEVRFVFDTKMAAFHGQIGLLYEQKYEWLWNERRITHIHVNDYHGGYLDWENLRTLPIGKGSIDFDRFFSFIRKKGYDGAFTVESTAFNRDGTVDVEMLNKQFTYIQNTYSR